MILLSRLDEGDLRARLAQARTEALTYSEAGSTRSSALPSGYRHDRLRLEVGHRAGDWALACDAILRWRAHAHAGVTVTPPDAALDEGTTVLASRHIGPLTVLAPCRIVYRTDEPSRFGFAYGTLPGHPEQGEEAFHVVRHEDGSISAEIVAFSRPADLSTRLAGPVGRQIQRIVTRRYLQGIQVHVAER